MSDDGTPYGDYDMEDAFSAEGEPAPEQTGRKIHNERGIFVLLLGQRWTEYDDLDDDERTVAEVIAEAFIDHLDGRNTIIEEEAITIHDVQRFFNPDLPTWDELPDPEKFVGRTIVQRVLLWMTMEGTIR